MKEVKTTDRGGLKKYNFYLSVLERIKKGQSPAMISKELGITKQTLNHYLATLKQQGCIVKIGYGVWEFIKNLEVKEVKKPIGIGQTDRGGYIQDHVRGHGFLFKIQVMRGLRNWDKREAILSKLDIDFKDYLIGGIKRGQIIDYKGYKIRLTDKSIIIHLPESFIKERATTCRRDAVYRLLVILKGLENTLKADFKINGKYFFKVSRQHYALIKNALAQQYDAENKKLYCYSGKGLWLLIDNSFNLHETETVHPETADIDNLRVQNFFNGLKETPGFTPQFVTNALGQQAKNLEDYAVHLKAHVESVVKLGQGVEELTKVIKRLEEGNK